MKLFNEKKECCGCAACANICPKAAITMERDNEGFEFPIIDSGKCIDCGLCIKVCPIKVSTEKKENENKKKHIGIINLQNTNNYGAVIAAAVLEDVVRTIVGDSYIVNTIDYSPKKTYSSHKERIKDEIEIAGGIRLWLNTKISKHLPYPYAKERKQKFDIFKDTFLKLTPKYTDAAQINKDVNYSAFITGSDIVWGPKRTKNFRSEGYYLKFADKGEKRIAFAPSLDHVVNKKLKKLEAFYKENLKNMDCISVREKSNVDFIQSLTDKKVYQCYDPAFLVDADYYDDMIGVAQVKPSEQKFIYVYILEYNQEIVDYANKIAKEKNLKICYYSANHKNYTVESEDCATDGPAEFLYRLKNAEYILTNSFHCIVFSLLFKKQFLSFIRSSVSIKSTDLLRDFGLENRIATKENNIDDEIDFSLVDKKLSQIKESSIDYLKNALKDIK